MSKQNIIMAWSGGKDSSLALWKLLNSKRYNVVALLSTFTEEYDRLSMHGVRRKLIQEQADKIGLPLLEMFVNKKSNKEYEYQMDKALNEAKDKWSITGVAFGDIFLEDLKEYRDNNLSKVELAGVYPLWKIPTSAISEEFLKEGFKTKICCVNDKHLNQNFVGVDYNKDFLEKLPTEVDVCGENGEFHSFCYEGPIFKSALQVKVGEKLYKPLDKEFQVDGTKGFWFADVLPIDCKD